MTDTDIVITASTTTKLIAFPRTPRRQLDLFGGAATTAPSTAVAGLVVSMIHAPCPACGAVNFIIGSSAAMHSARLTCAGCGGFGGWLSKSAHRIVQATLESGRPATPVIIDRGS